MVLLDLGDKEQAAQLVEDYTAKYAGRPEYMNSPDGEHAMFVSRAKEIIRRLQKRGLAGDALTLAEGLTAGVDKPSLDLVKALAVSRIKAGKLAEATAATEKLLKDYPMDEAGAMAVVEVAAALRKSGQLDKAMGLYEYARGIAKGTKAEAMARAGRAQIWVTQGKDEDVKAEVDAIIADANSLPDAGLAVFVIGEEYYLKAKAQNASGQGNVVAAKAEYEKAIAILQTSLGLTSADPKKCNAYYVTGLSYRELGDYVKAADALQKAYQADPAFEYADYCLFENIRCYGRLAESGKVSRCEAFYNSYLFLNELNTLFPGSKYIPISQHWLVQCTE
jgi:tetratricopeptide (TPR) repeat protein